MGILNKNLWNNPPPPPLPETIQSTGNKIDSKQEFKKSAFAVIAILVIAFFIPVHFTPAFAVDDECQPLQRGTEQSDGTFTPGSADSDIDLLLICSGDHDEGIPGVPHKLEVAQAKSGISDEEIDFIFASPGNRLILDLSDVLNDDTFLPFSLDIFAPVFVLRGEIVNDEAQMDDGAVNIYTDPTIRGKNIKIESHLDIETRGNGRRGLGAFNDHGGDIHVRNFGYIHTYGGGYLRPPERMYRDRRATGMHVGTEGANEEGEVAGNATVINETGARILTEGAGGRGIGAYTVDSGAAKIINRGTIETKGEPFVGVTGTHYRAYGAHAGSDGTGATTVTNEGSVKTTGDGARGITTSSEEGMATTTNYGTVETEGNVFNNNLRADAVAANSGSGIAIARNLETGIVTTKGTTAHGVYAFSESGNSESINRGVITTQGDSSRGIMAGSYGDGNPATLDAEAINYGTITTSGSRIAGGGSANGMLVFVRRGSARAVNEVNGSITTSGTSDDLTTDGGVAGISVSAGFGVTDAPDSSSAEAINRGTVTSATVGILSYATAGSAILKNFGTVTVDGENARALWGYAEGSARTHITVDNGTVVANGLNNIGIYAQAEDDGVGPQIPIQVEVSDSIIRAMRAAEFAGARAMFSTTDSQIMGDIVFDDFDDTMEVNSVTGATIISGSIDFGDGTDELILNSAASSLIDISGGIRNLNTLIKRGTGRARVGSVEFSGSSATIENGLLIIRGHMNLGDGEMAVKSAAQLVFEFASSADHGRVTAQTVTFETSEASLEPQILVQIASDCEDVQACQDKYTGDEQFINAQQVMKGSDVIDENEVERVTETTDGQLMALVGGMKPVKNTELTGSGSDTDMDDGTGMPDDGTGMPDDGTGMPDDGTGMPDDGTGMTDGGKSSGSGRDAVGGLALLAVLFSNIFDDDDGETEISLLPEDIGGNRSLSFTGSVEDLRQFYQQSGVQYQVRSFNHEAPQMTGGASASIQGSVVNINTQLDNGIEIGFSAAPNVTASSSALGIDADGDGTLKGNHFGVQSSWKRNAWFIKSSLSHGRYDARSVFDNPVNGDSMNGEFNFTQSQMQLGGGASFAFGGVRTTPSLSLFSGSLSQSAYTASGTVFHAEVPDLSWKYRGWKAGLTLSPESGYKRWAGLSLQPKLHLSTQRIRSSNSGSFELNQSDALGVLDFKSRVQVQHLPRTVHSLGASMTVKKSSDWRLKLGYAGLIIDNEPVQAVMARMEMRF